MQNQVTVPALASVYNEKALKSQFDTSIYLQVCVHLVSFLALHSILCYLDNAFMTCVKLPFDCDFYLMFQNLFLYGYGAIFNFLGLVVTAIIQGNY